MYDMDDMTPEEFAMASFFAMEIMDEEDKDDLEDDSFGEDYLDDDDLYGDDSDLYGDGDDSWD